MRFDATHLTSATAPICSMEFAAGSIAGKSSAPSQRIPEHDATNREPAKNEIPETYFPFFLTSLSTHPFASVVVSLSPSATRDASTTTSPSALRVRL